jgi:hypothetical protein
MMSRKVVDVALIEIVLDFTRYLEYQYRKDEVKADVSLTKLNGSMCFTVDIMSRHGRRALIVPMSKVEAGDTTVLNDINNMVSKLI